MVFQLILFIDHDDASDARDLEMFLKLAKWSQGIPRSKYDELQKLMKDYFPIPSVRRMTERIQRLTKIQPQFIDCCYHSCVAFTGTYRNATHCPVCEEKRYIETTKRARKQFLYLPILHRLRLQYRNPARARVLSSYRQSFSEGDSHDQIRDVFDGDLYRKFHVDDLKLFQDSHDIAFHLTLDGFQLANMRHHEVTPVILINLNLPPEERYKKVNILASTIIPGPNKPKDLDSFLRPLVEELKQLDDGAEAFDGNAGHSFTLRAWVTMVTGDGPAVAEAMGFKRPGNALRPCRCCMIESELGEPGNRGKQTYYVPHTNYDFSNPPLRENVREVVRAVATANSDEYRTRFGINRASILLELRSIHFPRSFPIDIMHCVLLNLTETLFKLWIREKLSFEKDAPPSEDDYHLSRASLKAISKSLATARGDIPSYLGHAPRPINRHYNGYKAAEWEAWVRYYGVPLLDQHLGEQCVDNFRQLSRIYSLSTKHTILDNELTALNDLTVSFVRKYEELYYREEKRRLPVCSINLHSLLHLPSQIRDCASTVYSWQFTMERYCGIVKPLARSKSQMNTSLANGVINQELFNHVPFIQTGEPELAAPPAFPILLDLFRAEVTTHMRRSLSEYLHSDSTFGMTFYKRCQVSEKLIIGSKHSQRRGDINRQSNRVCYQPPGGRGFMFATIVAFIEVLRPQRCLAWVRKYDGIDIDRTKRVASFAREGGLCWIEVTWIRSLFGILRDDVNLIVTDVNLFD